MNEVVETIYQWHQGRKIQQISTSLGLDRKTVRKYLGRAQELSLERNQPLPDEQELIGRLKTLMATQSVTCERPAHDLIAPYRDEIAQWLEDPRMTAKQVWRLLKEHYQLAVGYTSVKRYVNKEFPRKTTRVPVRIETPAGTGGGHAEQQLFYRKANSRGGTMSGGRSLGHRLREKSYGNFAHGHVTKVFA
jgi:transposase